MKTEWLYCGLKTRAHYAYSFFVYLFVFHFLCHTLIFRQFPEHIFEVTFNEGLNGEYKKKKKKKKNRKKTH